MNRLRTGLLAASLLFALAVPATAQSVEPFLGRWALTIPGGGAGWLEVRQENGYLDGSILWGGGSVVPVESVYVDGDTLYVTRTDDVQRKNGAGETVRTQIFTETIAATVSGDTMSLTTTEAHRNGLGVDSQPFTGTRIPDLPPAPDLSKVKYGKAIKLFNGKNLKGWELINKNQTNGWSVKDGVLINDPKQEEGKPHISYGNLRTVDTFEDFNLTMDVAVVKGGNSGIYLRGIYEVQVEDTYGEPVDSHNMGAIYSRITPSVAVEKPADEWQTIDITLVDRHVTVILNGTKIIDNAPLMGCTGGAMTSNEFIPGPIYLQGDHAGVKYRNIVLKPVKK